MDFILDVIDQNDPIDKAYSENFEELNSLKEENENKDLIAYNRKIDQLSLEICNVDRYIKENLNTLTSFKLMKKDETLLQEEDPLSSLEFMW